jgi:sterol O-acyltransferase
MSSSADIQMNGNGHTNHDHILRPRAVKPANQAVLRTLNEEGLLAADNVQNGNISGQTRCDISSLELH